MTSNIYSDKYVYPGTADKFSTSKLVICLIISFIYIALFIYVFHLINKKMGKKVHFFIPKKYKIISNIYNLKLNKKINLNALANFHEKSTTDQEISILQSDKIGEIAYMISMKNQDPFMAKIFISGRVQIINKTNYKNFFLQKEKVFSLINDFVPKTKLSISSRTVDFSLDFQKLISLMNYDDWIEYKSNDFSIHSTRICKNFYLLKCACSATNKITITIYPSGNVAVLTTINSLKKSNQTIIEITKFIASFLNNFYEKPNIPSIRP